MGKQLEQIIIKPENKKLSSVIQAFLKEMKIHFKLKRDETKMSEREFYARIDEAIQQVKEGKYQELTPELKRELFESIL